MWDHAVEKLLHAPSDTSIPEQSLAEYRNKVIEDCAVKADALANCEENTDGYRNGAAWCAEAIRAMKEQLLKRLLVRQGTRDGNVKTMGKPDAFAG